MPASRVTVKILAHEIAISFNGKKYNFLRKCGISDEQY